MEIKDRRIDAGKPFDWGRTSKEYARFKKMRKRGAISSFFRFRCEKKCVKISVIEMTWNLGPYVFLTLQQ